MKSPYLRNLDDRPISESDKNILPDVELIYLCSTYSNAKYGLRLTKCILHDIFESITKQYMNSIPAGEMVLWTLYVLFFNNY